MGLLVHCTIIRQRSSLSLDRQNVQFEMFRLLLQCHHKKERVNDRRTFHIYIDRICNAVVGPNVVYQVGIDSFRFKMSWPTSTNMLVEVLSVSSNY